jgi:hypothetical protein
MFPVIIATFGGKLDNWSSKEKGLQHEKNLLSLLSWLRNYFSLSPEKWDQVTLLDTAFSMNGWENSSPRGFC